MISQCSAEHIVGFQPQVFGLVDAAQNQGQRTRIVGHPRSFHVLIDAHNIVRSAAGIGMQNPQTVAITGIYESLNSQSCVCPLRIAHIEQSVLVFIAPQEKQSLSRQQSVDGSLRRDVRIQVGLRMFFGDTETVVIHRHNDILVRETDGCLGIQIIIPRRTSVFLARGRMVIEDEAVAMVFLRPDGVAHDDGSRKSDGRMPVGSYGGIRVVQPYQPHVHGRTVDDGGVGDGFLSVHGLQEGKTEQNDERTVNFKHTTLTLNPSSLILNL